MLKSNIQKISDDSYFIIDFPYYTGTIMTYDHTLANQTICHYSDNPYEELIEEIPKEENQQEEQK